MLFGGTLQHIEFFTLCVGELVEPRLVDELVREEQAGLHLGHDRMNFGSMLFNGLVEIAILDRANERQTERTDGDHAHAANRIEQQSSAARILLGHRTECCWPEKGLAASIEGGRQEQDA